MRATLPFAVIAFFVACAAPQPQQAPGLTATGSIEGSVDANGKMISPNKDFEEASVELEDEEGLFLAEATIAAAGGGVYKQTKQGYQYYNKSGQATSWFGQPGDKGSWALTQGNYSETSKSYGFTESPSLLLNKKEGGTWSGDWKQYDSATKKYAALGGGANYDYSVNYNPKATTNPWTTKVFEPKAESSYVQYNSWLPQGTSTFMNNGKAATTNPYENWGSMQVQGTKVPTSQNFQTYFNGLGDKPFAR